MSFNQNDTTKKFIEEVETLVKSGQVASYKEIAEKIGLHTTALHLIQKGERNVPTKHYNNFTKLYVREQEDSFKEKYILLLEKQLKEKETLLRIMQERFDELLSNLVTVKANQLVFAAIQKGYQEWWVEQYPPKGKSVNQAKQSLEKKLTTTLERLEREGIS
jgi:hypothetical protein